MKIISIILCVLTIIMLGALAFSIIKNNDSLTSNKEKRYILIYIFSFITLMISSIFSTLGMNVISVILFVVFILLAIVATIILLQCRKINEKKHTKPLVPKKLKNNLEVIKDSTDGYTYKVQTKLTCCDDIFEVHTIKDGNTNIVRCVCDKCQKEYEVYNSELDGYKIYETSDLKIIKNDSSVQECSKCSVKKYNVEITYGYMDYIDDDIDEIKKLGVTDTTNIFTSMKMNLICKDCNKKEKDLIDYEYKQK